MCTWEMWEAARLPINPSVVTALPIQDPSEDARAPQNGPPETYAFPHHITCNKTHLHIHQRSLYQARHPEGLSKAKL